MKTIPLTQGRVALVDDEDFEMLSHWKWYFSGGYARSDNGCRRSRGRGRRHVGMHHLLMLAGPGEQIDHRNGNGLDNQRGNLRLCSPQQNQANARIRVDNTSGFKGVRWNRSRPSKWRAVIRRNGAPCHLGYFTDPIDAARAYDTAARELFGEFARVNFPVVT